MSRTLRQFVFAGVSLSFLIAGLSAQSYQLGTKNGEWPAYAGDLRNYHYSPLDQINASNFNKLEVAWRFKTDSLGTRPEYKLEGTPMMVKGVVYATAGTRRSVVALDAATGELLWVHGEHEGARGAAARAPAFRPRLVLLDRRQRRRPHHLCHARLSPGRPGCEDRRSPSRASAQDGIVDMKKFAVYGTGQPIDLMNGEIGLHSTPAVTKSGIVLVGSAFREGGTPKTHNNTKGHGAGLRRPYRQEALAVQYHSAARRIRQRHLAERILGHQRQHRRLDADRRR